MKQYKAVVNGEAIADGVIKADSFFARLKGLMGRKTLDDSEGLLIVPCGQIHTFFMRFPIDVLYLSKTGVILGTQEAIPPGRVGKNVKGCFQVLELKSGIIGKKSIAVSQELTFSQIG